jgi:hypothetical protein
MALGVAWFALAALTGIVQAGPASAVVAIVAGVIFTTIGLGMTRTAGLRRQLAVIAGPKPLRAHLLAQRNRSSEGRGGSCALAITDSYLIVLPVKTFGRPQAGRYPRTAIEDVDPTYSGTPTLALRVAGKDYRFSRLMLADLVSFGTALGHAPEPRRGDAQWRDGA